MLDDDVPRALSRPRFPWLQKASGLEEALKLTPLQPTLPRPRLDCTRKALAVVHRWRMDLGMENQTCPATDGLGGSLIRREPLPEAGSFKRLHQGGCVPRSSRQAATETGPAAPVSL